MNMPCLMYELTPGVRFRFRFRVRVRVRVQGAKDVTVKDCLFRRLDGKGNAIVLHCIAYEYVLL